MSHAVSTVSFEDESYRVSEGAGMLTVNVTRSGDTDILATVLVATDNFVGTASGMCNLSINNIMNLIITDIH